MRSGFIFCGVDIEDIGLYYAPELQDTYVHRIAQTNISEETFEGHDGGYYYGEYKEPKEFILRCIFEETFIDDGFLTKVYNLFKIGKTGKLVFKRRPWCYYNATVVAFDDRTITNYLNGIITITMKAYYPYAVCDSLNAPLDSPDRENALANSALYDTPDTAPQRLLNNVNETRNIILGNPGTEPARVTVTAAGTTGEGVTIRNNTTNQELHLTGISKAATTSANKEVIVNGINGKTVLHNLTNDTSVLALLYHGGGFIELEPAYPAKRDVTATFTQNSDTVTLSEALDDNYVGKYIWAFSRTWYKITAQNGTTLTIDRASETSGTKTTTIMFMNELTISGVGMDLDRLEFFFRPTFA